MKKILASVAAAALTVSAMGVAAFAADNDFDVTFAGQFDSDFNATVGEWPADATASGNYDEAVTVTLDFGTEKVKLAGNYLGIKTTAPFDTAEGAVNHEVVVTSIKADGNEVAFDASKVLVGDNDSQAGTIKISLFNEWDNNIAGNPAVDYNAINGEDGFSTLSVTFTIKSLANNEGDTTTAPDNTTAGNGGTDGETDPDKTTPNSGIEGVAVVAGLAIVAAGAVVVAKKRK